jgi:alanyl-tRNA synthetase
MLKFETNEIPAGLESYYEATDGGAFRLKVEGVVPVTEHEKVKGSVKEFRDNNIVLKQRVESLARFEELFKNGDFSEEKLSAKVTDQANKIAAEMKTTYEQQLAELQDQLSGTSKKLESVVLTDSVTKAALAHGVSETAIEDVLLRAKTSFKVVDGALTAADGVLDAKGKPLTVDSWVKSLNDKAPHLFKQSRGAGSQGPGKQMSATEKTSMERISAGLAKLTSR